GDKAKRSAEPARSLEGGGTPCSRLNRPVARPVADRDRRPILERDSCGREASFIGVTPVMAKLLALSPAPGRGIPGNPAGILPCKVMRNSSRNHATACRPGPSFPLVCALPRVHPVRLPHTCGADGSGFQPTTGPEWEEKA